jgi:hypothetical protein
MRNVRCSLDADDNLLRDKSEKVAVSFSSLLSLFLSNQGEIGEYSPLVFAKWENEKSGKIPDSHFQRIQRNEGNHAHNRRVPILMRLSLPEVKMWG